MHQVCPVEEERLAESSMFNFACNDSLPCFTQCCRDVNIYLTPYDILRLRKALGEVGSAEFLARYTQNFLAKVTNIPVVQLLMDSQTLCCPFVTEQGCSVYLDRPWACRMFPLDLASGGEYTLIAGKERCKGLFDPAGVSVGQWLEGQGVGPYAEMEKDYLSVVPERFKPGSPMNEGLGRVLFLAYDLDRFAQLLGDPKFRSFYDVDDAMLARVGEDAEELLKLAFRYIRAQMEDLY